MEINLLVLNVGNSRTAIGTFVAGKLEHAVRMANDDSAGRSKALADAWNHVSGRDGAAVVGASVNPRLIEQIEHAVEQVTNQQIAWVGQDLEVPIHVATENPEQTGVDRVLNVAAAYEQMGKACVVVDAGSAITVDVCNDKGDFLGGSISAGVSMMLDALHQHTAKLPRVQLDVPTEPFGRSTEEAIRQGVFHGVRGMVKELVENYATELGIWPDIIATGGDAQKLFEGWELIHAISPDLTLYGIALAYAEHHIENET